MTALGLISRWVHLGAGVFLVGTFAFLLLAGRSDRPTALTWERGLLRWTRWAAGLLLLSGLLSLSYQAAVVTGHFGDALSASTMLRLISATQFGTVWLLRHGLLLLLAAVILLREREDSGWDWAAFRGEGILLGATGLGLMAWAGHAAAVEPWGLAATGADALHLLAVGVWLGGLGPLCLLLRMAGQPAGADARPFAVLAARSFSQVAFVAMLTLAATGVWNSWHQVGNFASLAGTRYGRLLLLKLGLLLPIVALAAVNRLRLLPALSGEVDAVGRPAMRRLALFVGIELALGAAILAVVILMASTPPGRHTQPWWPFPSRLTYPPPHELPGTGTRLLIGSQVALVGLLGAVAGWFLGWRRRLVVSVAAAVLLAGLGIALPPLVVEAYPTTYRRSPVPYHAASIADGRHLYTTHCATCHGPAGRGDGPAAGGLPRRSVDLTDPHLAHHTAGDLFWWVTHGIPGSGMPGFGGRLSEGERWDVVNFLRTLSAVARARALSEVVEPARPWLAAPDFTYAVGPGAQRSLKDFRGRRVVLLVLFTLPDSRPRLSELARNYDILQTMGAEVVAVPADRQERIISRLGPAPRILFPVVTEGGSEVAETYFLFRVPPASGTEAPSHVEFLIDRQGYLRARWTLDGKGWTEMTALLAEIQQLNQEETTAPPPEEHVH
ncbi:MAG: CopD family protein [Candidatus Rokubacteria bacterium]|nr:CopD family protein [Candidatus Rokubacteria bacterium]